MVQHQREKCGSRENNNAVLFVQSAIVFFKNLIVLKGIVIFPEYFVNLVFTSDRYMWLVKFFDVIFIKFLVQHLELWME